MKFDKFTEQLKKDFEERLPDVYDKVKDAPYFPVAPEVDRAVYKASLSSRGLRAVVLSCLVVILALAAVLPIIFFNDGKVTVSQAAFMEVVVDEFVPSTVATTSDAVESPEINMTVFEGIVTAYTANNTGNYMLTGETIKGLSVADALAVVARLSDELGYVGVGDGVKGLRILVAGQNAEVADSVKQRAKSAATNYYATNNVRAVVTTATLDKESLVKKAQTYDSTASTAMTVSELNEIIENGKNFITTEVAEAYNSDTALAKMKSIYVRETFRLLSALTEQFVDETYAGDRVYAEQRVKAMLSAYLSLVESGQATLGGVSATSASLTPWDVIDNIEEVLAAIDSTYLPEGGKLTCDEKTAVAEFASSFKTALLDATAGFSDKKGFSGGYLTAAFRFTTFDFQTHLIALVEDCNGFAEISEYVKTQFQAVMSAFNSSAEAEASLQGKNLDTYLVDLEGVVAKAFAVEKSNLKNTLSTERAAGGSTTWASREEYEAWASQITGEIA